MDQSKSPKKKDNTSSWNYMVVFLYSFDYPYHMFGLEIGNRILFFLSSAKPDNELPSIPGLDWSSDMQYLKEQALKDMPQRKKLPFSRPIPKCFEQAWISNQQPGLLVKEEGKYRKTCVKQPLSKRQKTGFQDQLSLNARQKYCRMLQVDFRLSLSYQLLLRSLFCLFLSGPFTPVDFTVQYNLCKTANLKKNKNWLPNIV